MRLGHVIRSYSLSNQRFTGGDSGGDTPVPIPNTEVKATSADGTDLETDWKSRSLPVSIKCKMQNDKSKCKISFIIITLVILFLVYCPLFSHPVNPYLIETTLETEKINFTYENYYRKTIFFYGYKKKIRFKNYLLGFTKKNKSGLEYSLSSGLADVDLDKRKTDKYGYEIRFSLSKDIWGDMIVFPIWKWYIDISKGDYNFKNYLKEKIDIDYKFTAINLSLICSEKFGLFIPYCGVVFFCIMDKYTENTSLFSSSSVTNGLSPFVGIKLQLLNKLSIQWETGFINETGNSISLEFVL